MSRLISEASNKMQIEMQIIHIPQLISEVRNNMQADIRQQLSEALTNVDEQYARLVTDSMTEVEAYPTPFLKHHQIYQVEHFNPNKPILFYVGLAPGKPAYVLTGHPENYVSLAKADTIVIDSPQVAVDYATAYLEVTRSMSQLFYLVRSAEEVKFRPNLTSEEAKQRASFIEKYRLVITAPTGKPKEQGYVVTTYTVREQALERHSITVSKNGEITTEVTTLEQDLPLVYGL